MADIVLGDLITWPETGLRVPGNVLPSELAIRPVSWAVGIRPTTPALPALRGDEVVILSLDVLTELGSIGGETLRQLFDLLAEQPISGLIMDHPPPISPPAGLPLLLGDVPFPADVESRLNRLLTERRAALYNLGSRLARGLSAAALSGATLDDVLDEAASATGFPLALATARGSTIGRSTDAPAFVPAAVYQAQIAESATTEAMLVLHADERWMVAPVSSHALPDGVRLAVRIDGGRGSEVARLTVTQTADALRVLFDRARPLTLDRRDERERVLKAFLNGALPAQDSRVASVFSAIDLGAGIRLLLLMDPDERLVDTLRRNDATVITGADEGEHVGVVPASYEASALSETVKGVISGPLMGADRLPETLQVMRSMRDLLLTGEPQRSFIQLDRAEDTGVPGVLLQLLDAGSEKGREIAAWFCLDLLGPLLEHDAERDSDLSGSLRAYLEAGRALGTASEQLGIHRNTLAYRLSRIRELTGRDPDVPRIAFEYHIALLFHDLLQHGRERQ